ncbi:MAG: hypothetical protein O7B99_07420, partial [Planctomycetota bacterium]|nr:hypothetical protein [Planctomycetota bacterium]
MWIFVLAAIALLVALFYAGRTWLGWALPVAVLLGGWWFTGPTAPLVVALLSGLFVVVALFTGVRPLRRATITPPILRMMKPILPR